MTSATLTPEVDKGLDRRLRCGEGSIKEILAVVWSIGYNHVVTLIEIAVLWLKSRSESIHAEVASNLGFSSNPTISFEGSSEPTRPL